MTAIEKFCRDTGFRFESHGEIGFGRPCVGIMNPETECYVSYQHYEIRNNDVEGSRGFEHRVAESNAPDGAYHKGPYLAVLVSESRGAKDHDEAKSRLEKWIQAIIDSGYKVVEYVERDSFATLLAGGTVVQKGIADKKGR